jgi:hypothetical protein
MTEPCWHIARRPALAWVETAVKLLGTCIAVYALTLPIEPARSWTLGPLSALLVLALLSVGLVATIWGLLKRREIVSTVLVIPYNVGHWSAVAHLALVRVLDPPFATFAAAMLLGDLIKILEIQRSGFGLEGVPRARLILLTGVFIIGYAALLGLAAAFGI